jgi:hypothetical protein
VDLRSASRGFGSLNHLTSPGIWIEARPTHGPSPNTGEKMSFRPAILSHRPARRGLTSGSTLSANIPYPLKQVPSSMCIMLRQANITIRPMQECAFTELGRCHHFSWLSFSMKSIRYIENYSQPRRQDGVLHARTMARVHYS